MEYLLDTNILVRTVKQSDALYPATVDATKKLQAQGNTLSYVPQNIREFWNVCTRPADKNGLGFTPAQTEQEVQAIEGLFSYRADTLSLYTVWRQLVVQHQVLGAKVHDAYLASAVIAYGLDGILTFNGSDFTRYGITVLDPHTV